MTEPVILLNDPSTHGGHMQEANGFPTIGGIHVCVDQDQHTCPQQGHGTTPVTATSAITSIGGKKVIRQGDTAGCGAVIQATQTWVVSD
jgi:uncharacterized Zn-binding protein involved in type VI secretion